MTGIFEWLIKLLFIVMVLPFLLGLAVPLVGAVFLAALPWAIAMAVIMGVTAGVAAAVVLRRRLPPPPNRFPAEDVPRFRRPRGSRAERW